VLELVPPVPEPDPPAVPVPGRHAARRRATGQRRSRLVDLLPETLRGRVALSPWHLSVVALVVAVALAVTCWRVMRADPAATPVASRAAAPLVSLGAAPTRPVEPAEPGASGSAAAAVTVDVTGKVLRPGVRELPPGSRVVDALEAAGGVRPGADLTGLNRARLLVDGEQIVVGGPPPPGAVSSGPAPSGPAPSGGAAAAGAGALVNLNSASLDELDGLPEVGPVTAQAILDYRAEHGGFGSVDELLQIDGIGEKTLAKIAPHVTV
jgi:competence protein ComEA